MGAAMTVFEGYMRQYLYDKWIEVQRLQPMYYI